ncbi:MAG: hypothetical protein R3D67_10485 [Hyphomicrobiaceae bacterium]
MRLFAAMDFRLQSLGSLCHAGFQLLLVPSPVSDVTDDCCEHRTGRQIQPRDRCVGGKLRTVFAKAADFTALAHSSRGLLADAKLFDVLVMRRSQRHGNKGIEALADDLVGLITKQRLGAVVEHRNALFRVDRYYGVIRLFDQTGEPQLGVCELLLSSFAPADFADRSIELTRLTGVKTHVSAGSDPPLRLILSADYAIFDFKFAGIGAINPACQQRLKPLAILWRDMTLKVLTVDRLVRGQTTNRGGALIKLNFVGRWVHRPDAGAASRQSQRHALARLRHFVRAPTDVPGHECQERRDTQTAGGGKERYPISTGQRFPVQPPQGTGGYERCRKDSGWDEPIGDTDSSVLRKFGGRSGHAESDTA